MFVSRLNSFLSNVTTRLYKGDQMINNIKIYESNLKSNNINISGYKHATVSLIALSVIDRKSVV